MKINRCLEHDKYCSRFATETCPVRHGYAIIQDNLEKSLAGITIKDLMEGKPLEIE